MQPVAAARKKKLTGKDLTNNRLRRNEILKDLESQHIISGYDVDIGLHLADVLSGGANSGPTDLSEQDLYDLERQSLIKLIQSHKTRDRIHAMLSTGRRIKN